MLTWKKLLVRRSLCVACSALSVVLSVQAQPPKRGPLFEPNYTNKIMQGTDVFEPSTDGDQDVKGKPKASAPDTADNETNDHATDVGSFQGGVDQEATEVAVTEKGGTATTSPAPSASPAPSGPDLRDNLEANPIRRISLVINAKEGPHLSDGITQLIDIASKYDLKIGTIYRIGWTTALVPARTMPVFLVQGGKFKDVDAPPAKYPVKKSPTWIVETDKGEIILEGFPILDRFVNSKGQFVANTGFEVARTNN